MERQQRKQEIVSRVGSIGPCVTAKQIARDLKMAKSPHFMELLKELTDDGELVCQWAIGNNKRETRYFSTPGQAPCLL